MQRQTDVTKRSDLGQRLGTTVSRWISPAGNARAGGDWCDVVPLSGDALALTVGDVSGHGEPASGTMQMMRSAIAAAVVQSRDPSAILASANTLANGRADGAIITAIVAILDRRLRTLTFANAGHPPPLMVLGDAHAFLAHSIGDLPLGIFPVHRSAEYVIALHADSLLIFYTDGITEHKRDPVNGEFELAGAGREAYGGSGAGTARRIADQIFANGRGDDDAAILAVRTALVSGSSRWPPLQPAAVAIVADGRAGERAQPVS